MPKAQQYAEDCAAMLAREGILSNAYETDRGTWSVGTEFGITVRVTTDGLATIWTKGAGIDHTMTVVPVVQDWYHMRGELMSEDEVPR